MMEALVKRVEDLDGQMESWMEEIGEKISNLESQRQAHMLELGPKEPMTEESVPSEANVGTV